MTYARRLAALVIAMEAGYEFKAESGHTVCWEDEYGPGLLMTRRSPGKPDEQVVMQLGEQVCWQFLYEEAKRMTPEQFESIEKEFRSEQT